MGCNYYIQVTFTYLTLHQMFNTQLKPNSIVRMGELIGVVEGGDIYRPLCVNVYNNTTKRLFAINEISDVLSEKFVDSPLFAYQIFNLVKKGEDI